MSRTKVLIYLLTIMIIVSGCSFINALPNSKRDKWYMEHAEEFNKFHDEALTFLNKVKIGFTKDQVIEAWGEPWKRKSDNYWLYKFTEYFSNKITVKFENGIVVEKW